MKMYARPPHLSRLFLLFFVIPFAWSQEKPLTPIEQVLKRQHVCNAGLSLRSSALNATQEQEACAGLAKIEKRFRQIFTPKIGELLPVKHDHNDSLRANIYASQAEFTQYAGKHFNMPTNNGGMYLEGLPDQPNNHAEFVAYQNDRGQVHNLGHEYVHYLDGRYNLYGDFCATLHDSHAEPENCPRPAPMTPYLVWWTEGIAEYIARGDQHPAIAQVAAAKTYQLSQLFDTAYEKNHGRERIYTWGYFATRYMLENQREKIDQMLQLTRHGDYPRYQALIRSWGDSMDAHFHQWLDQLGSAK